MDTQSRPRGFSPLFRGPYSDLHMRVSDAERQEVADRLAEHYAAGRLDQAEFDDRVGRAMAAKTRADLGGLFADLPETGAPVVPVAPRRRHRHPVLLLVAIVAFIVVASHAVSPWVWFGLGPWLWVGLLVVAVLWATGHFRRARREDDDC